MESINRQATAPRTSGAMLYDGVAVDTTLLFLGALRRSFQDLPHYPG